MLDDDVKRARRATARPIIVVFTIAAVVIVLIGAGIALAEMFEDLLIGALLSCILFVIILPTALAIVRPRPDIA